jgi:FkbM family methyltransferase
LRLFVQEINRNESQDMLFLDCGAHIGLVSHYVAHSCKGVQRAFAFEPNESIFSILAENCRALPNSTTPMRIALSSFTGRARLIVDGVDADGSYIEPDSGGSIQVTTVDELGVRPSGAMAMKIDVEGSELPILQGALKTLSAASGFVVLFEAHKHVMERSGYDPLECVRFLNSIRKCSCLVTGQPDLKLDLDKPFFAQVGAHIKRDILVYSAVPPGVRAGQLPCASLGAASFAQRAGQSPW